MDRAVSEFSETKHAPFVGGVSFVDLKCLPQSFNYRVDSVTVVRNDADANQIG